MTRASSHYSSGSVGMRKIGTVAPVVTKQPTEGPTLKKVNSQIERAHHTEFLQYKAANRDACKRDDKQKKMPKKAVLVYMSNHRHRMKLSREALND